MSPTSVIIWMCLAIGVFIAMDVVLFMDNKPGNTYSEIIRKAGRKWLPLVIVISFCFGLLAGHWWL